MATETEKSLPAPDRAEGLMSEFFAKTARRLADLWLTQQLLKAGLMWPPAMLMEMERAKSLPAPDRAEGLMSEFFAKTARRLADLWLTQQLLKAGLMWPPAMLMEMERA